MTGKSKDKPTDDALLELYNQYSGNISEIARQLQKHRTTVKGWYERLNLRGKGERWHNSKGAPVQFPNLEPDIEVHPEDTIDYLTRHFEVEKERRQKYKWFPIKINDEKPIGLSFFGDPHLGDNGCNYPLIKHHAELCRETDGLYAVNIGDTANNWIGGLQRLYMDQDSSRDTERKLADWFLNDAGIKWLVWLMGNHDMWGEFSEILRGYNIKRIPMADWQAQFKLVFPNGRECKIWAAHDFKGNSMWNSLHGPQKAAHMKEQAHIYACGHTHNWAMHHEESASREFTYWLIRSRGYKFIDTYSDLLGHFPQKEGATITAVIDPHADSMAGFIQCFADMDAAADYLTWKRQSIQ